MDLKEITDLYGELQQDSWSVNRPHFGENNHLTVIGWAGLYRKQDRRFVVHCSICAKDSELNGEGYFISYKFSLTAKIGMQLPCACAVNTNWTEHQYTVLCKRKLTKLGLEFLGWSGSEFVGGSTKVRILCPSHGEFCTTTVKAFVNQNNTKGNCRKCGDISKSIVSKKPISFFLNRFYSQGKFPATTEFSWIDNNGSVRVWSVRCGDCGGVFQSLTYSLVLGGRGCGCSYENQKEAYILEILNNDGAAVGIKFGVSGNARKRSVSINRLCVFNVRLSRIYRFGNSSLCRSAENSCKNILECAVISKENMLDGWSETTHLENFEKVEEIYRQHGGNLVYSNTTE